MTNSDPARREQLRQRILALPRVRLAHLPTPLEHCPRLARALGGPDLYVKRDDLTGLAFGGNKTRQLEFLLADMVEKEADVIVVGAYTQSNWCRQITAAARKLEREVSLVLLHGEKGPVRQGNLLLDDLMGADITVTDIDDMQDLPPLLEHKAEELRAAGRRPYLIDPFDLDILARSTVGYVEAAIELDAQLDEAGVDADHVYVAGANMTPAGLLLGLRALGRKACVAGVAPIEWDEDRRVDIARIANATAKLLDLDLEFAPEEVTNHGDYIGERYGVLSEAAREAFLLAARSEGLILDPVYTSKAMAGLIDHVRRGLVGEDEVVVFVHTGGNPAVFAYAEDLLGGPGRGARPRPAGRVEE